MRGVTEPSGGCPFPGPGERSPAPGCPFPGSGAGPGASWDPEAHARAMRRAREAASRSHVSERQAETMAQRAVEQRAARRGLDEIGPGFVDALSKKLGYGHPLSERGALPEFEWTEEAEARLSQVPAFCRELTRWRVEYTALKKGLGPVITPAVMDVKYEMWGEVSHAIEARRGEGMPWTASARERFDRVPDFVRGQVLEAVEGNARTMGATEVDDQVVDRVIERWASSGDFHEGLYGFR